MPAWRPALAFHLPRRITLAPAFRSSLHAPRRSFASSFPLTRMAEGGKVTQPEWLKPVPKRSEPVLKVYNSLTRSKVRAACCVSSERAPDPERPQNDFIPLNGRRVDWYNCGPTVYDAAHMGHARWVAMERIYGPCLTS